MTEPIIEAGLKISTLLGQSFFMPFALTMLACLARLRVLVQQILLDVVCVFNMSASVSQAEQSSRLTNEGPAVFRDYYPPNKQLLILECHWDGVKFCLLEKLAESERKLADMQNMPLAEHGQGTNVEGLPQVSDIKYNSTEALEEAIEADELNQDSSLLGKRREEQSINEAMKNKRNANENPVFHVRKEETDLNNSNGHNQDFLKVGLVGNDGSLGSGMSKPIILKASHPTELSSGTKRKVAFTAVNLPSKMATELENSGKKLKSVPDVGPSEISPPRAKEPLDLFFNLLFDGNKNDSLFC